jgi:hypothetical protein
MKKQGIRPRIIIDLDEHTWHRLGALIPRGLRNEVMKQIVTDLVVFMDRDPSKSELYLGAVMQRSLTLRHYHKPAWEVENGTATATPTQLDRDGLSKLHGLDPVDSRVAAEEQESHQAAKERAQAASSPSRGYIRQLDKR